MLRLAALALGAFAPATFPLRAPVSAVAASDSGALALTADQVRIMDGGGFPVGRFARSGAPQPAPPRRSSRSEGGFPAAAGVLDDGDFNDPHDPDSDIEDPENILVEDPAPVRRNIRPAVKPSEVALALGDSVAWVGRDDGLWRLSFAGGAERMALPAAGPVRALAASPDGRVIVAALDRAIVWSEDGGRRFERPTDAPVRVDRLFITAGGSAYALQGERLWRLQEGAPGVEVINHGAQDATACGNEALALVDGRLFLLPRAPGPPDDGPGDRRENDPPVPPGADRVACSPDGATWVAYGAALWVSEDRGRTWTARDDLGAAFAIAAVAVSRRALWIGGGAGLAVLPLHGGGAMAAHDRPALPMVMSGNGEGEVLPRWRWWLPALPRVDVGFATARSNTRRDVRAFLLLSFTFDPRRGLQAKQRLDAEARASAQAEARTSLARRLPEGAPGDPIAAEERDAMSRLLN